jgi:hypothetical protein
VLYRLINASKNLKRCTGCGGWVTAFKRSKVDGSETMLGADACTALHYVNYLVCYVMGESR